MPQTKDLLRLRPRLEIMLQGRARCKFRAPYDVCSVANIPRGVLGTRANPDTRQPVPGVQIVERGRKIHEEKKRSPPHRFHGVQLTRSPLTTALYYLNAWNRLDTCRIRVDGQIRFGYGYVWTWTVLNPERKSCGFQNIWIRVDGAFKSAITVSRAILIS